MALGHLPGLGALLEALGTTNTLLEGVLEELRRTNNDALQEIAAELRTQQALLKELRATSVQSAPPAA